MRVNHPIRLMANRKPIGQYFDISSGIKRLWFKSESLFRYLVYKYYGLKPDSLPMRLENKLSRLRIGRNKTDQRNQFKALNHIRNVQQLKNVPKRFPYVDRLINAHCSTPPYLKKWRRTLRSDLTNFALITLAVQNSNGEDDMQWSKLGTLFRQLFDNENKTEQLDNKLKNEIFKLDNFRFEKYIGKGCNAAIYESYLKQPWSEQLNNPKFAIKMLFNYDIESNAFEIMKAMKKEAIPYDGSFGAELDAFIGKVNRVKLAPHPNIVQIHGLFIDQVPDLPKARKLFKSALPPRLHEQGYGRNMTLFIVMKRYMCNLKEYLQKNCLNQEQSLSLLTQLFSGVEYLTTNSIAHRDLKCDNILLDFDLDQNFPSLVITDFGLCTTELSIPYLTDDICLGGNRALTAPEIITAIPGLFSKLDYSKSDLWAIGAITYELYNNTNPFYPNMQGTYLNSYSYKESELPKPLNMPIYIEILTRQILNRNPSLRPDIEICTTLCNLLLFCDELSLKLIANSRLTDKELIKKINLLLSDTLFFARKKLNRLQLKLKLNFFTDLKVNNVKEAIKYFEI